MSYPEDGSIRFTDSNVKIPPTVHTRAPREWEGTEPIQYTVAEYWIVMEAQDTHVVIAVHNARPEADYDEDGYCGMLMEWDYLQVVEQDGTRRSLTHEEEDDYTDGVREYLRSLDWGR